ncbi:hypothetical protein [Solidesulfovibrio fructosivorans]|uniref:hypothetical protein n=1 Tax=Solidesulfovibrio fructosivorans TaxID=878 RepID=UPI00118092C1|nr:hypothetical protein [Solidesulfovibrio fructosivorans]
MNHLVHHLLHATRELGKEFPEETGGGVATGVATAIIATETIASIGGAIVTGASAVSGAIGTSGALGLIGSGFAAVAAINPVFLGGVAVAGVAGGIIHLIKKFENNMLI